jgi:ParB/RepB/Spo0J family partition protein
MSEINSIETTPVVNPTPIVPAPEVVQGPVSEVRKAKAERKKVKAHESKTTETGPVLRFVSYKELLIPKSEEDPRWDPRMTLPLAKPFVESIKEQGVLVPLDVTDTGKGYAINDGRTRARACVECKTENIPVLVTDIDEIAAMARGVELNEERLETPPTKKALTMQRMLSAGYDESEVVKKFKMTGPTMHGYLALLDLPVRVQKLVDDGSLSRTAALNLVHLDAAKVEVAADKIVAAAQLGVKTKASETAKAAGKGQPDRLNGVRIKAMVADLKNSELKGKHAKAASEAAILALELVLDARKWDAFLGNLDEIAKGTLIAAGVNS